MDRIPIAKRIERFKRFYAGDLQDGPLIGFFLETYYPLLRYKAASALPEGVFGPEDLKVKDFFPDYERLFGLYDELGGDAIWSAAAFWGIPWVELLAGCRAHADHGTGSTRSLPPAAVERPDDVPAFDFANPWVQKAREFLLSLREESRGRYPLATTLMRGISDLLSALYGSPQFIYRLIDRPIEQKKIARKLTQLWIDFARAQLDLIPDFNGGTGSFFYNLWQPGKAVMLQEDAAALLSPKLFGELIYPCICEIAESFDSAVIHLHPSTYIPVDLLLDTKLKAIELHIDFGGPSAEDLYPYYKKIQLKKPLAIWGDLTASDIDFIERHLDRQALVLLPVVKEKEEAERIWKRFKK